jgi:hypothetical protein
LVLKSILLRWLHSEKSVCQNILSGISRGRQFSGMHGTSLAARGVSDARGRPVDFPARVIVARKSTLTTQRGQRRIVFAQAHPRNRHRQLAVRCGRAHKSKRFVPRQTRAAGKRRDGIGTALSHSCARREAIAPFYPAAVSGGAPFSFYKSQPRVTQVSLTHDGDRIPSKPAMPFKQRFQ